MILNKILEDKSLHIIKGWGEEVVLYNDLFCVKILRFTRENAKGSLHLHLEKTELFKVILGNFTIKYIDTETADERNIDLKVGDSLFVPRGTPHQIICNLAGDILECSTFDEASDSYRISKGDSQV